jgi:protein PhnA
VKLEEVLIKRSDKKCELCKSPDKINLYKVLPQQHSNEDDCIIICDTCRDQVEKKAELNSSHWSCLTETMWSEVPGVQVVAWRTLNRLKNESWAMDNLDMMFMDDERLAWAKATGDHDSDAAVVLHKDCNGQVLQNGDSVTLIKSLDIKGSTLNAKMGTVVKNIRIVEDNTEQVEGKIEGQLIVILTKYVRKQNS